jgi:hypothetical protein
VLEELDVLDLVLRSVDGEEILQVDNFSDVADVVLAQIQDLQVHVWAQVSTQLLDFFLLQVQLRERIRAAVFIKKLN